MGKSLFRDDRGNVLAVWAATLPLLIGAAGMAVDGTQWVLTKRQAQAAVDAAATAGVYALLQGGYAEDEVARSVERFRAHTPQASVQLIDLPAEHAADPYAVAVRLSAPAKTFFASMFLRRPVVINATAVATVVESEDYCALAIGSQDTPGLIIEDDTEVEMECGLATNSRSSNAIQVAGGSSLAAPRITAFGGWNADGTIKGNNVRSYGLRQSDPFRNTQPPDVPNTGCPNVTVNPGSPGGLALKPGCYGNVVVNGTLRLDSGEYILNRGNLLIGPTGRLSCDGCSIFLTSQDVAVNPGSVGKVRIHERATVKLSAPKTGPNAGILIYQDRRSSTDVKGYENRIGGSSFSKLEGVVYFPSDSLRVEARASPGLRCARIISKRLIIAGRMIVATDCTNSGIAKFIGTEVRLVG